MHRIIRKLPTLLSSDKLTAVKVRAEMPAASCFAKSSPRIAAFPLSSMPVSGLRPRLSQGAARFGSQPRIDCTPVAKADFDRCSGLARQIANQVREKGRHRCRSSARASRPLTRPSCRHNFWLSKRLEPFSPLPTLRVFRRADSLDFNRFLDRTLSQRQALPACAALAFRPAHHHITTTIFATKKPLDRPAQNRNIGRAAYNRPIISIGRIRGGASWMR
jgi:hypothetical protein